MPPAADPVDDLQARIDALQARMTRRTFFVMNRSVVDPKAFREALPGHLEWVMDLDAKGLLLASGPAFMSDGSPAPGITVLRVETFEEAQALAATDPACALGAAKYHIIRWVLGAGRLRMPIDLKFY